MTNQTAQKFANRIIGSDVEPYEVVRIVNEKTMDIKRMEAELSADWNPEFHIGGFVGHCSNQNSQSWTYTSNDDNQTVRIRLAKCGNWKDANGNRYNVQDTPRKFHDYNH